MGLKKLGRKFYGVKKNLGQQLGRKCYRVKKNLGQKFGLAKFYFGLIRVVCVLLLTTPTLNNNTEFDLGGGLEPMWSNQLLLCYG